MKQCIYFVLLFFTLSLTYSQNGAQVLNDSALDIYKDDHQKAISILEDGLVIAQKDNDKKEIGRLKNSLGIVYRDLGTFDKAKTLSLEALNYTNDSIISASAYNNIGVVNRNLGLYDEAIEYLIKALSIYEAKNMRRESATTHNNIGIVYSFNNIYDKAIEYHLKAKADFEKLDDKKGISEVYNNIAIIYANEGNLTKALEYFQYSLKIEQILNDKKGIAESANNVGAVYYYMSQIDSALVYFEKSATLEKEIGNFAGLGASYNNIAQVLLEYNRVPQAKKYIDSAYATAKKYKVATDIEMALENYSTYYSANNQPEKALIYYKDFTAFKDSIHNQNTKNKIAELEIEYQTEKKEKEILAQRADLAEKELDLNRKNTQVIGLIILAVLLFILGYLFYSQQKLKNKQLQRESELKEALVKIETQNKLQEQRLEISRDLHDNIGAQLTFIISSLDNLKYGFQLPEKLSNKLDSIGRFTTSTIHELRDTIWAMNKNEITIDDLQARISNFIEKADKASEKITFSFHTENVNDTIKFTSVEGMNIYRIIQEAIHNALKYANPTEITVKIQEVNNAVVIQVIDNGKGFDIETVEFGNGLNNMKKRAHELEAEIEINSNPKRGTSIIVKKAINK